MKILLVSAELAEVAAVGGVAEYALGLAAALLRAGHDVRVAIPAYGFLAQREGLRVTHERLVTRLGLGMSAVTSARELTLGLPGEGDLRLPVTLLCDHPHFASCRAPRDVYSWPNHEPWIAFSRAVVDWLDADGWQPDAVHCQDAHTALVPIYIKLLRLERNAGWAARVRTVLTIHNLLNQGLGEPGLVSYAGLPWSLFALEGFEFFGQANCFKAGLLYADKVNTVSRTYAREISSDPNYGFGLEGVLKSLYDTGRLAGIVNGIDEARWRLDSLAYDRSLADADRALALKAEARARLYERWQCKPDRPLIALRGRWDRQKGVELFADCIEWIGEVANVALVTWGCQGALPGLRHAWDKLNEYARQYPGRVMINPEGIAEQSQLAAHYLAADLFLMPSVYEPCGLAQMECQRYGAIPIVRRTGGLADTVVEGRSLELPSPNGFAYDEQTPQALMAAIRRAVEALADPARRRELVANALAQRNGWANRVAAYEGLYR